MASDALSLLTVGHSETVVGVGTHDKGEKHLKEAIVMREWALLGQKVCP